MSTTTRRGLLTRASALLAGAAATPLLATTAFAQTADAADEAAPAADAVVEMLNVSKADPKVRMVFEPAVVSIEKGQTVLFQATDKGHNVESIDGMLPEGAEAFRSKIGQDFSYTFIEEGVYGYGCTPHLPMGMVGLVLVGDVTANYEAAKAVEHRGKATREKFAALFAEAEAQMNAAEIEADADDMSTGEAPASP